MKVASAYRVIRRKHWTKKGKRKKVRGDRRKGRVNVMGGIRYTDKKRWVDLIPTGNSQNFKSVLLKFYKDIQREWIEQGNKKEDFERMVIFRYYFFREKL
jgi:hypothetical protein